MREAFKRSEEFFDLETAKEDPIPEQKEDMCYNTQCNA